jgi:hypothetical protein
VQYFLINAALAQQRNANARMFRLRWMALPIKIMHEPSKHPTFAITRINARCIRTHARGNALHVMTKRWVGNPLMKNRACVREFH